MYSSSFSHVMSSFLQYARFPWDCEHISAQQKTSGVEFGCWLVGSRVSLPNVGLIVCQKTPVPTLSCMQAYIYAIFPVCPYLRYMQRLTTVGMSSWRLPTLKNDASDRSRNAVEVMGLSCACYALCRTLGHWTKAVCLHSVRYDNSHCLWGRSHGRRRSCDVTVHGTMG
ncbi:hypothetical protein DIPPA_51238 [Diplonema papillatum]|nr:hypothetical protein DIPPA_51238 [Diplonema papillatum]